ncbi:HGGxSTG domain-containing protein [Hyphomonas sp.]|uniref:HGGxSTG domain-containing protein n=1 Tax=Hyphomonas sp. TaxID=87 RepID=UPI0032EF2692
MARLDEKRKAKAARCAKQSERPSGPKLTGRNRKRCGARTRSRNGAPCQCKVVPGRTRCRFHGGLSTGPRTPEGKARCAEGLRQYFVQRSDIPNKRR